MYNVLGARSGANMDDQRDADNVKDDSDVEEVSVYFTCDKIGCGKQNMRKIVKYNREGNKDWRPIVNSDDVCDYCDRYIHEPAYIEF